MTRLKGMLGLALAAAITGAGGLHDARAQDTNAGYSGTFYNEAQTGHGFVFEVLEDGNLLVYWYTYRDDGTSTFLLGVATPDGEGRFTGTLSQTEGMVFGVFDPASNDTFPWGELTIEFDDCGTATARWTTTQPGYSDGETSLERLTHVRDANCRDSVLIGNYTVTFSEGGDLRIGRAILLPGGRFVYLGANSDGYELGMGNWTEPTPGELAFTAQGYVLGVPPALRFDGAGTATTDGFEAQTTETQIAAVRLASGQTDLPPASLAGSYTVVDAASSEEMGSVSLDADGALSGTMDSCTLGGTLSVPDPGFNQLEANIEVTQCTTTTLQGAGVRQGENLSLLLIDINSGGGLLLDLQPD